MKKFGKDLSIKIQQQQIQSPCSSFQKQSNIVPLHSIGSQYEEQNYKNQGNQFKNVVQFEEFLVQDDRQTYKNSPENNRPSNDVMVTQYKLSYKHHIKKPFLIEIPQTKFTNQIKNKLNQSINQKQYLEPPAPSHKKSSYTDKSSKNFMFPIIADQKEKQSQNLNTTSKLSQQNKKIQQLILNFDKERQQFYRQRSKYQKQLLVKQGQIQLLQNMLTGNRRIGGGDIFQNHYQQLQSILLQKDLQINELLDKISQINQQLNIKNEEIRNQKGQIMKLEHINQSLTHQIYLLENNEVNIKTTQQFYDIRRRKPMTPTSGWNYEDYKRDGMKFNGFDNLHKRLQNLRQNREDMQDRNKIKSEINYNQNKYKSNNSFQHKNYHNYHNNNNNSYKY